MKRAILLSFLALAVTAVVISFLFTFRILNNLNEFDWGQQDGTFAVQANDLTISAQEFLDTGSDASLKKSVEQSGYSVLLLDLNGLVMFDSSGEYPVGSKQTVNYLLAHAGSAKNSFVVEYGISPQKLYALAVIGTKQKQPRLDSVTSTILVLIAVLAATFLLFAMLLYLIINRQILRPFAKLEYAAGEIARGNLDTPFLLGRRNPFGAFTWAFDLLRNELKTSKAREEEAARTKKELIASLSHDVRTPIASISAYAECLQNLPDRNSDRAGRYIDVILKKTDEISKLTQDMFQHAVMDLDQLEFAPGEYPGRELLNGILEPLMLQYENKIMILSAFPEVTVFTDKQRLAQVFGNILSNIAKYAPDSPIHVQSEVQDGMLLCCLKDFGSGVSVQDLNFLFEKFYRGQNAKASGAPGAGLGLYTAKYIMDKTDGSIRAYNWHDDTRSGFAVEISMKIVEE